MYVISFKFVRDLLNFLMDLLDHKRIEILKDISNSQKYPGFSDVIPIIVKHLLNIIKNQNKNISYTINKWPVQFDNSFDNFSVDTKLLILRKVKEKYHDFNDIIYRTSENMYYEFEESGKSKLYCYRRPDNLFFKHMMVKENKLRFKIIVEEEGKGSKMYYLSAGGFFIIWDYF